MTAKFMLQDGVMGAWVTDSPVESRQGSTSQPMDLDEGVFVPFPPNVGGNLPLPLNQTIMDGIAQHFKATGLATLYINRHDPRIWDSKLIDAVHPLYRAGVFADAYQMWPELATELAKFKDGQWVGSLTQGQSFSIFDAINQLKTHRQGGLVSWPTRQQYDVMFTLVRSIEKYDLLAPHPQSDKAILDRAKFMYQGLQQNVTKYLKTIEAPTGWGLAGFGDLLPVEVLTQIVERKQPRTFWSLQYMPRQRLAKLPPALVQEHVRAHREITASLADAMGQNLAGYMYSFL